MREYLFFRAGSSAAFGTGASYALQMGFGNRAKANALRILGIHGFNGTSTFTTNIDNRNTHT
jgi:hypothetical protein